LGLGLITCGLGRVIPEALPKPVPAWLWCLTAFLFIAPLIPLPEAALAHISPGRVALMRDFPIEPGATAGAGALTCSISRTINRLWEMALILAGFVLARRGSAEGNLGRPLFKFIVIALGLLCLADLEFRQTGSKLLLGFWPDLTGHGASTFVNRNHFADWVCMGALFVTGGLVRQFAPLHTARGGRVGTKERLGTGWVFLGCVCVAASIYALVACGSRGGVIVLMFGTAILLVLVGKRSRRKKRWVGIGIVVFIGLMIGLGAADYLLRRLHETSFGFKLKIWADTLRLTRGFIWAGSGWGTFQAVFSARKSFGGGLEFLHAENEYLQLLLEAGLLGAIPVLVLCGRLVARSFRRAWSERLSEPEFYFAALAGAAAFLLHSVTEFVWQVPATGLLAAVLLGWLSGARSVDSPAAGTAETGEPSGRIWKAGLLAGLAVIGVAAAQGVASWHWNLGLKERDGAAAIKEIRSSIQWWPWLPDRRLLLFHREAWVANAEGKLGVTNAVALAPLQAFFRQTLEMDPYNWQLRLERARFDITFDPDPFRGRREAVETVRINPLYARLSLEFADLYATRDPDLSYEMLRDTPIADPEDLDRAYAICWKGAGDASRLWSLTPSTVAGWKALGDFALDHELPLLAVDAFARLEGKLPPAEIGERFLKAGRPDLAVKVIGDKPEFPRESFLLCQADRALGNWEAAIKAGEVIWRSSLWAGEITQPSGPADLQRSPAQLYTATPSKLAEARTLGETLRLEADTRRKAEALQRLHDLFPDNLRLHWLAFESARRADLPQEAAKLAEELAEVVLSKEAVLQGVRLNYDLPGETGKAARP
jgi:hypothetical protein